MNDQATTLRHMASAPRINLSLEEVRPTSTQSVEGAYAPRTRAIAVTGGKGGVGKSNFAVNVALALAARRRRVTLLDADMGLANADVLLGLNPQHHLGHVLSGQCQLSEVIVETEDGLRLIPGGSGVEELTRLTQSQNSRFIAELRAMEEESDYLIIDTAAGIAGNVTGVLKAAAEVVVVTTPEPTAVVDAYALIKVLNKYSQEKTVWIVVNDVVGVGDAEQTFTHLRTATERFLNHTVAHLGTIPRDPELAEAVREQVPVIKFDPETPASRAFRLIAKHLDQDRAGQTSTTHTTAASFWTMLAKSQF